MIIAVSSQDNRAESSQVAHHFGRCPYFTLVQVNGDQIEAYWMIQNPYFESHQPGEIPAFILAQGAKVIVSGGMGRRAGDFFKQYGIDIAIGAAGTAEDAVKAFLRGELKREASCSGHGHGHESGDCHTH